MAPLRNGSTRSRTRRPPTTPLDHFEDSDDDELANPFDEGPPIKRIRTSRNASARSKWIPGGRGGGGRHVDLNELDDIPHTPIIHDDYVGTGGRSARERESRASSTPRYSRPRRNMPATRPRYSTATAAAAAVAHGDGYKPREERGWEEFHPELDLDSAFAVLDSAEVDGTVQRASPKNGLGNVHKADGVDVDEAVGSVPGTDLRRGPGRPARRPGAMLNDILTPEAPKIIPLPGPNPRERLTLPKPSFREQDPFLSYEEKGIAQINFVDRTMANVGYQESEIFLRPERTLIRMTEGSAEEDLDLSPALNAEGENSAIGSTGVGRVEYDMDEQDVKWLEALNKVRKSEDVEPIKPAVFEITMTKIEKEWHALEKRIPKPNPKPPQTQRPRSSSAAAVNGEAGAGEEQDSKCAICDDGDCENANAIVFCDGCDLAVHQECYGVPYIPEGQWLCRKCQLIGRGTPTCIFCPNTEGAFKQTNSSKWAHLLCATWIPEVNLGNPSLMEPVVDVEKVPSNRWTLGCYICKQRMGASIQCSHKSCYQPFHPTCARRAQLFLRMKSSAGANSLMEKSQLRAYCDKHVPKDWAADHHTEDATTDAISYYQQTMRGRKWADSRASALALVSSQAEATNDTDQSLPRLILTNKKGQKPRTVWRLPSGAPVIPEAILKSIEGSLQRFTVRRKKEYVAEACKYWTLKREARRGAALLKRLQLQMDTFSSFEVTRRNYQSQGAAGRARLERRIDFAERLSEDLSRIREVCDIIKQRELEKLQDAAILKEIVDTVYFPIPPLLWPILEKAVQLDSKKMFAEGLQTIRSKLENRVYTSVSAFSADLARVFSSDLGVEAADTADFQAQVSGRAVDMDSEQRKKRSSAKRIAKTIQQALEDALQKESELTGRPYAQQIKEMDEMLIFSRRGSQADSLLDAENEVVQPSNLTNGRSQSTPSTKGGVDVEMVDDNYAIHVNGDASVDEVEQSLQDVSMRDVLDEDGEDLVAAGSSAQLNGELSANAEQTLASHTPPASMNGIKKEGESGDPDPVNKESPTREPPTPPLSLKDNQPALCQGGIPWYIEAFDPEGTTIQDERWTGPDVLREMSEELSEMDDDELQGLGGEDFDADGNAIEVGPSTADPATEEVINKGLKKNGKQKKRWRGYR